MIFLWRGLLLHYENYQARTLGPNLRKMGQRVYHFGAKLQGDMFKEDRRKN
jgi:hypothetical protein